MLKIDSSKPLRSILFFIILMLSLHILKDYLIYKRVKRALDQKLTTEIGKGVCKDEFRRLISANKNWTGICDDQLYNCVKHRSRRYGIFVSQRDCPCSPGDPGAPGPPGPPGSPGISLKGAPGCAGKPGAPGRFAPHGEPGRSGQPGPPGHRGPDGRPGYDGSPGLKGEPGSEGKRGNPGDIGPVGPPGASGINFKGEVYEPKDGVQGQTGERGLPGIEGGGGLPGPPGPRGPKGDKGIPGKSIHSDAEVKETTVGAIVPKQYSSCEEGTVLKPVNIPFKNHKSSSSKELDSSDIDCTLFIIEEKTSLGLFNGSHSTFMTDSSPSEEQPILKYWATTDDNTLLLEFKDEISLTSNKPSRIYNLEVPFDGNAHVVYDGFFFYKMNGPVPKIIRYNLKDRSTLSLLIPGIVKRRMKPLYLSSSSFVDFSVDESGLWAIYSHTESDSTIVIKIDHHDMSIVNTWEVGINNKNVIDMFIESAILYTVEYSSNFDIHINLAVDLLLNWMSHVCIKGIQQAGGITSLTYDHIHKKLLIVDGRQRMHYPFYCRDYEGDELLVKRRFLNYGKRIDIVFN